MDCVINRHGSLIGVPLIRTEIDDIHRRIGDKGTFDRDDLDAIVAHYSTVDPDGIRGNATEIAELYGKLNEVGRFEHMVPDSNSGPGFDDSRWPPPGAPLDKNGDWYDPGNPFGSISNREGSDELHLSCDRYKNDESNTDTGYEIEFSGENGYPNISLTDQPA